MVERRGGQEKYNSVARRPCSAQECTSELANASCGFESCAFLTTSATRSAAVKAVILLNPKPYTLSPEP